MLQASPKACAPYWHASQTLSDLVADLIYFRPHEDPRAWREMSTIGVVERAFQLAAECGSLIEVERALKGEGYTNVAQHLNGAQIRRSLRDRLNPALKAQVGDKIRAYKSNQR